MKDEQMIGLDCGKLDSWFDGCKLDSEDEPAVILAKIETADFKAMIVASQEGVENPDSFWVYIWEADQHLPNIIAKHDLLGEAALDMGLLIVDCNLDYIESDTKSMCYAVRRMTRSNSTKVWYSGLGKGKDKMTLRSDIDI